MRQKDKKLINDLKEIGEERRKNKIPFFHSILGKISLTVVTVIILTAAVNLMIVIPNVENIIKMCRF